MNFLKVANLWSDNLPIFASIFEKSRLKNSSYDSVIFGTKIQILSFAEIYWHLLSFTNFCCDLLLILLSFVETSWDLLSFTKICWVLLSFTEFCWVLLRYADICWVFLRITEIRWDFTEFCWDKLRLHIVRKSPKMSHLNFSILPFSTNFCHIARNVEWDFFCDFQTPWIS